MLRQKAGDVIENFLLTLSTWQHLIFSLEDDSNSSRENLNGQAICVVSSDSVFV